MYKNKEKLIKSEFWNYFTTPGFIKYEIDIQMTDFFQNNSDLELNIKEFKIDKNNQSIRLIKEPSIISSSKDAPKRSSFMKTKLNLQKKFIPPTLENCLNYNLLTIVYTNFGSIDIEEKSNLIMSSDVGPNNSRENVNSFPMNEGFVVTPSIQMIFGHNSKNKNYVNPYHYIAEDGSSQYYIILCELLVRCDQLRIPCQYSLQSKLEQINQNNYSKYIPAEFYIINNMNAFILKSVLFKKLTFSEYSNFHKEGDLQSNILSETENHFQFEFSKILESQNHIHENKLFKKGIGVKDAERMKSFEIINKGLTIKKFKPL